MKNKGPDRLYCREKDKEIYDLLRKDSLSPFKGKELIDIFMMALATGFYEKNRIELGSKRKDIIHLKSVNSIQESIIKSTAVAEEKGNLSVLLDKKKVYSIAEEYATGGIKLLKQKVFSGEYGSYIKKLESELVDVYKKFEKSGRL